jgi:hypothetical protein
MILADDSAEFVEIVGNEEDQTPFALLSDNNLRAKVSDLLEVLDDRERKIIFQRFGLDGGKPKTLEEVGKKLGVTRERIRQLQNIALAKLRGRACRSATDGTSMRHSRRRRRLRRPDSFSIAAIARRVAKCQIFKTRPLNRPPDIHFPPLTEPDDPETSA